MACTRCIYGMGQDGKRKPENGAFIKIRGKKRGGEMDRYVYVYGSLYTYITNYLIHFVFESVFICKAVPTVRDVLQNEITCLQQYGLMSEKIVTSVYCCQT